MPKRKSAVRLPDFEICGTSVPGGKQVQINLSIARLPSRTPISMPVFVNRGKETGPTLLLLAGMHGDEINGIETLRRMLKQKLCMPRRGTVVCIPIVNIYGFINFSREVPDGKDVNRSFPGSIRGSLAGRIAHHVISDIVPHVDCGIDFHTGGAARTNYPQIRCVMDNEENSALAHAFAPPFIVNAPLRPRSLRQTAAKMGKPIIVFEGGESMRLDEFAIVSAIRGTQRVMAHMGMIDEAAPAEHEMRSISHSSWTRAKYAGLFHAFVNSGDAVAARQIIGTITDPYGDFEVKLRAPFDGFVIGLANNPVVHQGDALMHIGSTEPMIGKATKIDMRD